MNEEEILLLRRMEATLGRIEELLREELWLTHKLVDLATPTYLAPTGFSITAVN